MKTVLVTGGSGNVGTSLKQITQTDENKWIFISSKDCDLINYNDTYNIFKKHSPTHVIHLAVKLMAGYEMKYYAASILNENIIINTNVLKCCHNFKVKKLISVLSSFAYPENEKMPLLEEKFHSGKYNNAYESYAFSKRHLEVLSRSYRSQFNDNFITVIPSNIFGPTDNLRKDGPVFESFVEKCISSKETGENIIIKGSGNTYRQFCYARDLSKILIWMLDNYNNEIPVNIAGKEISIKSLITKIATYFGIEENKIFFDTNYLDGPTYRTLSVQRLKNIYTNYKETEIDCAIKETIDYILKSKTKN